MSSPLHSKSPTTYSVCGSLLSPGESVTVLATLVGDWERSLESAGKLRILKTSKPGYVQVLHVM